MRTLLKYDGDYWTSLPSDLKKKLPELPEVDCARLVAGDVIDMFLEFDDESSVPKFLLDDTSSLIVTHRKFGFAGSFGAAAEDSELEEEWREVEFTQIVDVRIRYSDDIGRDINLEED